MDLSFIDALKFDDKGLIPAITQDVDNGEVLMVGWMNKDSLKETMETGKCSYWSRSRQKFWIKGESSGHTQEVQEVRTDCDKDVLLIKIKQNVGACHCGYRSCFSWRITPEGEIVEEGNKVFDPDKVY